MTTQALYNKWRGQTFGDILGQEHITRTLHNQIQAGRIGHAYLFTGVRGTGKTSTARILAKAVNCVGGTDNPPCNRCHICRSITAGASLDLIEVDAASNRGIDEIRDLRDKVNFLPSECKYKVYVIDEVHMLTREAFNALLKTLEEPPNHVIFVLCTTEPHKLPDTVLSRCQRFDFRRGSVEVITDNLARICAQEGIAIAPDALDFLARRAAGSFRDAVSLLDQLAAYGSETITLPYVQQILGTVPTALVTALLSGLFAGQVADGLRAIDQALDQGAEPTQFLADILDQLRALMLLKIGSADGLTRFADQVLDDLRALAAQPSCSLSALVRAIKLFNEAGRGLRTAVRPQLPLELALVEASLGAEGAALAANAAAAAATPPPMPASTPAARTAAPSGVASAPAPAPQTAAMQAPAKQEPTAGAQPVAAEPVSVVSAQPPTSTQPALVVPPNSEMAAPHAVAEQTPTVTPPAHPPALTLDWVRGNWRQVGYKIRATNPQVHGLFNSAGPIEVRGNVVRLGCVGKLVCDKLGEPKRRELVERALTEVLGLPTLIECVVCDGSTLTDPPLNEIEPPPGDLFTPPAQDKTAKEQLLNHPAVKELQKRGGKISNISLKDKQEDGRG